MRALAIFMACAAIGLCAPVGAAATPSAQPAAKKSLRSEALRLLGLDRRINADLDRKTTQAIKRLEGPIRQCSPGPNDAPDRAKLEAVRRATSLLFRHALAEVDDDLDRATRRYERFRTTSDTVRRAARAVGRIYRVIELLAASPPDLCGYWAKWQAADWQASFRIQDPPAPNPTRADIARVESAQRTIERAGRKFRRSGVSRSKVSFFVDAHDIASVLRETAL